MDNLNDEEFAFGVRVSGRARIFLSCRPSDLVAVYWSWIDKVWDDSKVSERTQSTCWVHVQLSRAPLKGGNNPNQLVSQFLPWQSQQPWQAHNSQEILAFITGVLLYRFKITFRCFGDNSSCIHTIFSYGNTVVVLAWKVIALGWLVRDLPNHYVSAWQSYANTDRLCTDTCLLAGLKLY